MLAFSTNILLEHKDYPLRKIVCVTYSIGSWFVIVEGEGPTSYAYSDHYDCVQPFLEKGKRYCSYQIHNVEDKMFSMPTLILLRLADGVQKATAIATSTPIQVKKKK